MKETILGIYLSARGLLLQVFGLFQGAAAVVPGNIKRILLIRIDRIGDMVMTLPAIHAVKVKFSDAEIVVLASPVTAHLLAADPSVKSVIAWDLSTGWRGLAGTVKELRNLHFDLAVDFCADYSLKTALIAFVSGAGIRLGYQISGRGIFFNLRRVPAAERIHASEESFELLKALGIDRAERIPEIFISVEAGAAANELLAGARITGEDILVAVHPGGHYPSQRWPRERFSEVAAQLAERYHAKLLFIGDEKERALVDATAAELPSGATVIKAINIRPDILCALIRASRLFIGNNSGPLHLASALGCPSVSTMGPTDPVKWLPLGPRQAVLRTALPCSGCGKGNCRKGCMLDITAAQVIRAAEKLLNERSAGSTR